MIQIRLQKYIRDAGIASRRSAEDLIRQGRVKVNGVVVRELGSKVVEGDLVEVNGKKIVPIEEKIYIKINKPVGFVTTLKDEFDRPIITDLIKIDTRVFPVGRLDMDTSGLLLLTNDGDLSNKLIHPSSEIEKKYIANVDSTLSDEELDKLRKGVMVDGKMTHPAKVFKRRGNNYEIIIHEGRNRQVRKMFASLSKRVLELKRLEFGNIKLGDLGLGDWKILSEIELEGLRKLVDR
ncbi:MAG: rRNA pseudouridine synthase [Tissierellia bacterium]|nr:rRNA pseudouridine synthase [Tissierellia bacterium]